MKTILVIFLLVISNWAVGQNVYSDAKNDDLAPIYIGKWIQSGEPDEAPVPYNDPELFSNAGNTTYNPYYLSSSSSYDSTGCYTITLTNFPAWFEQSNLIYATVTSDGSGPLGNHAAALAEKDGMTVNIGIFNQFDGAIFTITLFTKP